MPWLHCIRGVKPYGPITPGDNARTGHGWRGPKSIFPSTAGPPPAFFGSSCSSTPPEWKRLGAHPRVEAIPGRREVRDLVAVVPGLSARAIQQLHEGVAVLAEKDAGDQRVGVPFASVDELQVPALEDVGALIAREQVSVVKALRAPDTADAIEPGRHGPSIVARTPAPCPRG